MMKFVLITSLLSISFSALAAAEWKVISESEDCPEKIQILGKEGEKYVIVKHGDKQDKLFAKNGAAFSTQSSQTTFFGSETKDKSLSDLPTYEYTQPSYVEANTPKVDVYYSGRKVHCRMSLK